MARRPLQRLACQYGEPDFDLIEPGGAGRGKVEMDVLMPGQPAVAFRFMSVEIIKNDMDFAALIGLDDAVHEVEELDALKAHIDIFIESYNKTARPFVWTKSEVHQKRLIPRFSDQ